MATANKAVKTKKVDAKKSDLAASVRAAEPKSRLGLELRKQALALIEGGQAHATFDDAVKGFQPRLQGVVPDGLPYSGWQILEHLRIAQRDILDYSRNLDGSYKPLQWPEDYWPKSPEPPNPTAWNKAVVQIREDRKAFEQLLHEASDDDLITNFPWAESANHNLLREAFLVADHNAYHVGELIVLRRLLGAWKR
ncbi:MAG: DinB family protein [Acidobacteriaceae bacterium]|nr:DinB family protein [Acidobacteriaceae bacterium]